MTKILLGYPSLNDDLAILGAYNSQVDLHRQAADSLTPVTTPEELLKSRALIRQIPAAEEILKYIAEIVRSTRIHPNVQLGSSPRGAIHMLALSKALAAMEGRDFVIPDDVKRAAPAVLRHRLILTPEAQVAARTTDLVLQEILSSAKVPR
jgi:MoxR-like ATPase